MGFLGGRAMDEVGALDKGCTIVVRKAMRRGPNMAFQRGTCGAGRTLVNPICVGIG
jgi:hypothetical protein